MQLTDLRYSMIEEAHSMGFLADAAERAFGRVATATHDRQRSAAMADARAKAKAVREQLEKLERLVEALETVGEEETSDQDEVAKEQRTGTGDSTPPETGPSGGTDKPLG